MGLRPHTQLRLAAWGDLYRPLERPTRFAGGEPRAPLNWCTSGGRGEPPEYQPHRGRPGQTIPPRPQGRPSRDSHPHAIWGMGTHVAGRTQHGRAQSSAKGIRPPLRTGVTPGSGRHASVACSRSPPVTCFNISSEEERHQVGQAESARRTRYNNHDQPLPSPVGAAEGRAVDDPSRPQTRGPEGQPPRAVLNRSADASARPLRAHGTQPV